MNVAYTTFECIHNSNRGRIVLTARRLSWPDSTPASSIIPPHRKPHGSGFSGLQAPCFAKGACPSTPHDNPLAGAPAQNT